MPSRCLSRIRARSKLGERTHDREQQGRHGAVVAGEGDPFLDELARETRAGQVRSGQVSANTAAGASLKPRPTVWRHLFDPNVIRARPAQLLRTGSQHSAHIDGPGNGLKVKLRLIGIDTPVASGAVPGHEGASTETPSGFNAICRRPSFG